MLQHSYLKHIPQKEVISLASCVDSLPGQIVSKTLAQNAAVSITLFAFDQGEEISTHEAKGDALVTVLEGIGQFTVDGEEYTVQSGESLLMPANKPHAVWAKQPFKMMLTVVFPWENDKK